MASFEEEKFKGKCIYCKILVDDVNARHHSPAEWVMCNHCYENIYIPRCFQKFNEQETIWRKTVLETPQSVFPTGRKMVLETPQSIFPSEKSS